VRPDFHPIERKAGGPGASVAYKTLSAVFCRHQDDSELGSSDSLQDHLLRQRLLVTAEPRDMVVTARRLG
jgi:hypothetical protein